MIAELLLGGIMQANASEHRVPTITIEIVGTGPCAWVYEGRRFAEVTALGAALPKLERPKRAHLRIVGDSATPYRCIGGLVFEMQVANYGDGAVSFEERRPAK